MITRPPATDVRGDEAAEAKLGALAELTVRAGGALHPAARWTVRGRQLKPEVGDPAADGQALAVVPAAALPAVTMGTVGFDDDRLVRRASAPAATKQQTDVLEAMLDLYNALDRPRQWRQTAPWLALAGDTGILDHLARGLDLGGKLTTLARLCAADRWDEVATASFLGSRTYSWHDGDTRRAVLMPFIDFLDHHWDGAPFERRGAPPGIAVAVKRPRAGDSRCHARYGRLDALTSYLNYAFVDTEAPIVNSVPARIPIDSDLTLAVRGRPVKTRADAGRLGFGAAPYHVPRTETPERGLVTLDHVVVADARAPWAVPALLTRLLGRLRPELAPRARSALAEDVRLRLVAANEAYYARLLRHVDAARAPADTGSDTDADGDGDGGRAGGLAACQRLAEHQLTLLARARARPADGPARRDPGSGAEAGSGG